MKRLNIAAQRAKIMSVLTDSSTCASSWSSSSSLSSSSRDEIFEIQTFESTSAVIDNESTCGVHLLIDRPIKTFVDSDPMPSPQSQPLFHDDSESDTDFDFSDTDAEDNLSTTRNLRSDLKELAISEGLSERNSYLWQSQLYLFIFFVTKLAFLLQTRVLKVYLSEGATVRKNVSTLLYAIALPSVWASFNISGKNKEKIPMSIVTLF